MICDVVSLFHNLAVLYYMQVFTIPYIIPYKQQNPQYDHAHTKCKQDPKCHVREEPFRQHPDHIIRPLIKQPQFICKNQFVK